MHKHLPAKKTKSLKLAKQAKGTMEKVISMLEQDTYCLEIIQQTESITGLLKTLKKELLAGHLDTCVLDRLKKNKTKTVGELLKIYKLSD